MSDRPASLVGAFGLISDRVAAECAVSWVAHGWAQQRL